MIRPPFFVDRRTGHERRTGDDQRQNPRLDLSHRRRRKTDERRRDDLIADFQAVTQHLLEDVRENGDIH